MKDERAGAAWAAVEIPLLYARRGQGMAQLALAGARHFEAWRHYPAADAIDAGHGTQFYYHAHDKPVRGEHGHFHLFVSSGAERAVFHHLVALSLDALGRPLRWFTTNRWVTGEQYLRADALQPLLSDFSLSCRGRMAPLARWLQALVRLDAPQIEALLRRRDALLARRAAQQGWDAALEDRRLHIVSQARIDMPRRIAQVHAHSTLT